MYKADCQPMYIYDVGIWYDEVDIWFRYKKTDVRNNEINEINQAVFWRARTKFKNSDWTVLWLPEAKTQTSKPWLKISVSII